MAADELDRAMRRTYRYWYEDGLAEIAAGGSFLVGGLILSLIYLIAAHPPESPLAVLALVGVIIFALLGTTLISKLFSRIVTAVKNRITYPRTGYVAYHPAPVKQGGLVRRLALASVAFVLCMVFSAALSAAVVALRPPDWVFSMAMVQGVVIGIALFGLGWRLRVVRFQLMAGVSVLAGIAIALSIPPSEADVNARSGVIYFAIMGIILIASGLITLVRYLRRTEPAEEV